MSFFDDFGDFGADLIPRDYDDCEYAPCPASPQLFASDTFDLLYPPSPLTPELPSFHPRSDSLPPPQCPPVFPAASLSPQPSFSPRPAPASLARSARAACEEGKDDFVSACGDRSLTFEPNDLGFVPVPWPSRKRTFGDLVTNFFTRKSSASSRFLHKLVNALKIVDEDSAHYDLVGVAWVTDTILKVDKVRFARLLGIKTIDGSLFHKQGNFPSHGFVEICPADARKMLSPQELEGVDFDIVRLITHEAGEFSRGNTPDVEDKCRWKGGKKEAFHAGRTQA
jgi:hypothetical protein